MSDVKYATLSDIKRANEHYNRNNTAAIQSANHTGNYAILDKAGKRFDIYDKDNNLIDSTDVAGTGASGNDYNTITYTDKTGNMSTPAGITQISGKGQEFGAPSFTRARVNSDGSTGGDIAASMHKGVKGGSNGCVRFSAENLDKLSKTLDVGMPIYTLPEREGSRFEVDNGRLSYKADNPYGSDAGDKKYWDDYNVVINKDYQPLNITYKNAEDSSKAKDKYISALSSEKEKLMKEFGINNEIYDNIARIAAGIPQQESKYGDSTKFKAEQLAHSLLGENGYNSVRAMGKLAKRFVDEKIKGKTFSRPVNTNDVPSRGITKIKMEADNEEMQKFYRDHGIDINTINDEHNAAVATMGRLISTYKNEVMGKEFKDKNGNVISPYDVLMLKYNGHNKYLKNGAMADKPHRYIRQVNDYADRFEFTAPASEATQRFLAEEAAAKTAETNGYLDKLANGTMSIASGKEYKPETKDAKAFSLLRPEEDKAEAAITAKDQWSIPASKTPMPLIMRKDAEAEVSPMTTKPMVAQSSTTKANAKPAETKGQVNSKTTEHKAQASNKSEFNKWFSDQVKNGLIGTTQDYNGRKVHITYGSEEADNKARAKYGDARHVDAGAYKLKIEREGAERQPVKANVSNQIAPVTSTKPDINASIQRISQGYIPKARKGNGYR